MSIEIGDSVKISDDGKLYRKFDEFARKYADLSKWLDGMYPDHNDIFIVRNKAVHPKYADRTLLIIESKTLSHQYIMGIEGVKEYDDFELEEELFMI